MGICISSASPEIHQSEDGLDNNNNNIIHLEDTLTLGSIGNKGLGSLYTKEGSKGLNQDAAILHQGYGMEGGALCGVFDGHGKNGHIVSKIVGNRLASLLLSQKNALTNTKRNAAIDKLVDGNDDLVQPSDDEFNTWKDACVSAFKVMDKEIKLQESLDCSCSGTTAVVVLKQGEDLVIANLGDSRAVLGTIDEDDILSVQLTTDLKPSLPSEAERIRKCNGRVLALKEEPHIQRVWLPHEDSPGLAMSRAFGDFLLKNHGIIALPHISYRRLTANDLFIVLATDGVWDVLSNDQVAFIVWMADSEEAAAKAVVDAAASAWKTKFPSSKVDDCTAVCLFLKKKKQQQRATHENLIY